MRAGRARATAARRALAVLAVAVATALTLVACSIPTDDEPRVIADETTTSRSTPASNGTSVGSDFAVLYLAEPADVAGEGGDLIAVRRSLDAPPTPTGVLEALFASPLPEDTASGYVSLIPPGTSLLSAALEGTLLTVELSEEWSTLRGPEQTRAYAQVVLTATELDEVSRVRFQVLGDIVEAPTPTTSKEEVGRSDYAAFEPPAG